jgi:cold shock CspA family protein
VLFRETPGEQWDLPKVADWGLAAFLIDHSGSVEGLSPDYAAPEQFDADTFGEPSDFTDIYQLGCVLFELLTGQPPFEGSGVGVMHSILDEDPPAPTAVDSSLPAALNPLLECALAKRQRNRQETVFELRRGLERVFDEAVDGAAESAVTGNAPTAELGGCDTVEEELSELAGSMSVGLEWLAPTIEQSDVSDAAAYDFERFLMDSTVGTFPAPSAAPVRLTVADGSDATMFGTVVRGRLASGTLFDDDVIAMPGGATGSVDRIERDGDVVTTANQGDRVSVSIDDVDREAISRGEVLAVSRAPCVPETVVADLFLVDDSPVVTPGYTPAAHVGTASSACTVESIDAGVDPEDGSVLDSIPDFVQTGDAARVTLRPETPTVLEPFVDVPQLGVFAVRDMGRTVALGVVREVEGTDDTTAATGGDEATVDESAPTDALPPLDDVVVTFDDVEGTGTVACDALDEDVHFDITDVNGPDLAVGQSVAVAVEGDGERLQARRLERR